MPLNLSAGDFKKRVILRQYGKTKNSEGGLESESVLATILTWAAERKIDQKRVLEAGSTGISDTRLIYIRYAEDRAEIGIDWRIEIEGKQHAITSRPVLIESGLKVFEITCKAK